MHLVTNDQRRVGVLVQPVVLAGAIATILLEIGRHVVVPASDLSSTRVDALVADHGAGQDLVASLVIELPEGPTGTGRIRTRDGVFVVAIDGASSILELIERYCP